MKELMHYLNELGANVRNHMSTIEDKFVDEARQKFGASEKKPKSNESSISVPSPKPVENGPVKPTQPQPNASVNEVQQQDKQAQPEVRPASRPTSKPPVKSSVQNNEPSIQPRGNVGYPQGSQPIQKPMPKPAGEKTPERSSQPQTTNKQQNNERPFRREDRPQPNRSQLSRDGKEATNTFNNNKPKSKNNLDKTRDNTQTPPKGNFGERKPFNNNPSQGVHRNKPSFSGNANAQTTGRGNKQTGRYQGDQQKGENWNNKEKERNIPRSAPPPAKKQGPGTNVKSVELPATMTVKDFSQLIELAAGDVIKKLMQLGMMATINQEIDRDTMILLADEYGISATAAQTEEEKLQVEEIEDAPETLIPRPPVVTIMGHVDHGKTSLLDALRETNVTAQEAGGITQHIGAYQVELNDRKITFLDTPGHAAFTAMRARGAQATDIAILVVAADDGVMPQTIEAVNHAKDANVPIIVAINKIDKPDSNPDRIKQDLTEYGLVAEEWGGDTIFVPVSAKKRIGLEHLLEMILLVADMKDFRANPDRPAKGTIIEAQLDKGRGPVATVLVQTGTLQLGDSIIAGAAAGKVRALNNDKGKRVKKALPSTPVEVIGFDELPSAGDIMYVVTEDRLARQLADKRMQLKRETELQQNQKVTLNDLFSRIKEGEIKELKVIIKADVQGSVEAIRQALEQLSNDEVKVKVIHGGVGGIGERDVMLASAANAIIFGFNVRPDPIGKRMAEKENVDIRLYRIIYNIIDDVKKAMEGLLEPEFKEVINGRAEIRVVYKVPKVGNIGGCYVTEGKINRNNEIRLIRDNIVIHEGKISSLKRFKDDVREVAEGFECGIGIEKFNDIREGDVIEAFIMEEIKRQGS